MDKINIELEDLKGEHVLYNEKIKLLSISITHILDNIDDVLKEFKLENTILNNYTDNVRTFSEIILELSHLEIEKADTH